MNKFHAELLELIKATDPAKKDLAFKAKYEGSTHPSYGLSLPQLRKLAKTFMRERKDMDLPKFQGMLDSLYAGRSIEEKLLAGIIFAYSKKLRLQVPYSHFFKWFDHLEGWAEVDNTCQSTYSGEEVIADWSEWREFIRKLSKDRDIHRRRASLVLQVRPARESDDKRIKDLAFEVVDQLKTEKDILITKAISWLLRSISETNKVEVQKYVQANLDSLPKIAVRETLRKIQTGKK